jgi:heme exporter protein CcmD
MQHLHIWFVLGAYGAGIVLIGGLIAHTLRTAKKAKAALESLEQANTND